MSYLEINCDSYILREQRFMFLSSSNSYNFSEKYYLQFIITVLSKFRVVERIDSNNCIYFLFRIHFQYFKIQFDDG